nr:tumor necrosis factor receptor superfamily member 11B-like [Nerophis lumbriciformis]
MLRSSVLLLLLCSVRCQDLATGSPPTYEHRDPYTGLTLACKKCPPGTHMSAHCTAATQTQCAPCKDEHFTELWNYLPKCLYCNNFCVGDKVVETECSSRSNRVCQCKEGYYMMYDYCNRHSECDPGHGVLTRGTSKSDTMCQKCSSGYFSASYSAIEACAKHTKCASEQLVLLNGSSTQDTVCGLCEELANGGELLRTFLSSFFSMQRMRPGKMKRFVNRHIKNPERERHTVHSVLLRHGKRHHWLDLIRMWLHQATRVQLEKLPSMLRASQLNNVAEKLGKRLRDIQEQKPNCTLTHLFSFN